MLISGFERFLMIFRYSIICLLFSWNKISIRSFEVLRFSLRRKMRIRRVFYSKSFLNDDWLKVDFRDNALTWVRTWYLRMPNDVNWRFLEFSMKSREVLKSANRQNSRIWRKWDFKTTQRAQNWLNSVLKFHVGKNHTFNTNSKKWRYKVFTPENYEVLRN